MKKVEKDVVLEEIIKKLSKKYNKKEEVVEIMVKKCVELGYNIDEAKRLIKQFYN